MDLYICLIVGYLKEMYRSVVRATCLLAIHNGEERLHIRIGQIEIEFDRGFNKPRLNFVKITGPKSWSQPHANITFLTSKADTFTKRTHECGARRVG